MVDYFQDPRAPTAEELAQFGFGGAAPGQVPGGIGASYDPGYQLPVEFQLLAQNALSSWNGLRDDYLSALNYDRGNQTFNSVYGPGGGAQSELQRWPLETTGQSDLGLGVKVFYDDLNRVNEFGLPYGQNGVPEGPGIERNIYIEPGRAVPAPFQAPLPGGAYSFDPNPPSHMNQGAYGQVGTPLITQLPDLGNGSGDWNDYYQSWSDAVEGFGDRYSNYSEANPVAAYYQLGQSALGNVVDPTDVGGAGFNYGFDQQAPASGSTLGLLDQTFQRNALTGAQYFESLEDQALQNIKLAMARSGQLGGSTHNLATRKIGSLDKDQEVGDYSQDIIDRFFFEPINQQLLERGQGIAENSNAALVGQPFTPDYLGDTFATNAYQLGLQGQAAAQQGARWGADNLDAYYPDFNPDYSAADPIEEPREDWQERRFNLVRDMSPLADLFSSTISQALARGGRRGSGAVKESSSGGLGAYLGDLYSPSGIQQFLPQDQEFASVFNSSGGGAYGGTVT